MTNRKSKTKIGFSLLIPIYNEEKILEDNIKKILKYLKDKKTSSFNIIICNNASKDNSAAITKKVAASNKEVRHVYTNKKGIGAGLKEGIKYSKYDNLVFFPIDLSVNLNVIDKSLEILKNNVADVVIGSKGHKYSKVKRPVIRKVLSYIHNLIFETLFCLNVKDPHGTFAFRKSDVIKFIGKLTSNDAFFQTQFLIWAKKYNNRILEIPITASDFRSSTYNIKIEMISILVKLFKEYFILLREKLTLK